MQQKVWKGKWKESCSGFELLHTRPKNGIISIFNNSENLNIIRIVGPLIDQYINWKL